MMTEGWTDRVKFRDAIASKNIMDSRAWNLRGKYLKMSHLRFLDAIASQEETCVSWSVGQSITLVTWSVGGFKFRPKDYKIC